MELNEAKKRLRAIEPELEGKPWVLFHTFERDGRLLHLAITERLRKNARKERIWRSKEMAATLKSAAHGFNETYARSIFVQNASCPPIGWRARWSPPGPWPRAMDS